MAAQKSDSLSRWRARAPVAGRPVALSAAAARRIALAAQGFRDPRPSGRVDRRHLRRGMGRLGLLQLDSIPVVTRSQYLPLFSRLGPYDPGLLDRVAYADDEWFEAWCHEASLLPVGDEPLLRWAKARVRSGDAAQHLHRVGAGDPGYVEEVLAQVRERPLASRELVDSRRRRGEWWDGRSIGSVTLDWLFRIGEVGIRRRPGFVKEYDIIERIVPADIRARATPAEDDAHRELLARAAACLGVAAVADLIDYHRLPKRAARARVEELLEDGRLVAAEVEGWNRPALLHPDAAAPRRVEACALLSPFDPVVWFRDRARRLFAFDYKIEIYTPAAQRAHGYYVLPFLLGDRLAARVDAKTDRRAGTLRVLAVHGEPGINESAVVDGLRTALDDLARFVQADRWEVDGTRGNLARRLVR